MKKHCQFLAICDFSSRSFHFSMKRLKLLSLVNILSLISFLFSPCECFFTPICRYTVMGFQTVGIINRPVDTNAPLHNAEHRQQNQGDTRGNMPLENFDHGDNALMKNLLHLVS